MEDSCFGLGIPRSRLRRIVYLGAGFRKAAVREQVGGTGNGREAVRGPFSPGTTVGASPTGEL